MSHEYSAYQNGASLGWWRALLLILLILQNCSSSPREAFFHQSFIEYGISRRFPTCCCGSRLHAGFWFPHRLESHQTNLSQQVAPSQRIHIHGVGRDRGQPCYWYSWMAFLKW